MRTRLIGVSALLLFLGGCGSDSGAPTDPSATLPSANLDLVVIWPRAAEEGFVVDSFHLFHYVSVRHNWGEDGPFEVSRTIRSGRIPADGIIETRGYVVCRDVGGEILISLYGHWPNALRGCHDHNDTSKEGGRIACIDERQVITDIKQYESCERPDS